MEPTFIYADPESNVVKAEEERPFSLGGAFLAQSPFSCPLIAASINCPSAHFRQFPNKSTGGLLLFQIL
jgi:hypothetical protein